MGMVLKKSHWGAAVFDHGNGPEEIPLESSNAQPYGLHLVEMLSVKKFQHENYQLDPEILLGGLERLGVQIDDTDDLRVELFAYLQQHILPLY